MTDLDLALEKEAEGRRHDRRCMIAIKNPVCAPLTPVTGSYSWATPYPAFPGALSKPHCGESLNQGLIRGSMKQIIALLVSSFAKHLKVGKNGGNPSGFPPPFMTLDDPLVCELLAF